MVLSAFCGELMDKLRIDRLNNKRFFLGSLTLNFHSSLYIPQIGPPARLPFTCFEFTSQNSKKSIRLALALRYLSLLYRFARVL